MQHKTVAGLILAGGKNTRMQGRPKGFLTFQGRTFLEWERDALAGLGRIYLSVAGKADVEVAGMSLIEDIYTDAGPIGGICTAFERTDEDAFVILPCDVPMVNKNMIQNLTACYEKTGSLVILEWQGRQQPLIGVYPRSCLGVLREMIAQGDYRMMHVLDRIPYRSVLHEDLSGVPGNINDPDAYVRLLEYEGDKKWEN